VPQGKYNAVPVPAETQRAVLTMFNGRNARQIARWGITLETSWAGYIDYSTTVIAPVGAMVSEWREGIVPAWTPEQIETWRVGLERLRAEQGVHPTAS
jgi:hypothetical protein